MDFQTEARGVLPATEVDEDGRLTVEIPHGFADGVGSVKLVFLKPHEWGRTVPPAGDGVDVVDIEMHADRTVVRGVVTGYATPGRRSWAALGYALMGPRPGPSLLERPPPE
jgi:hypothetical protein